MALKDNWQDLQDAVAGVPDSGSEITVQPINEIAHAVIELEEEAESSNAGIYEDFESKIININIRNKTSYYYGTVYQMNVYCGDDKNDLGYNSELYFTTPSEVPLDFSNFPKDIYFKGDGADEGAFAPEPNTRYTIVFSFDGYNMNAYVSGVIIV